MNIYERVQDIENMIKDMEEHLEIMYPDAGEWLEEMYSMYSDVEMEIEDILNSPEFLELSYEDRREIKEILRFYSMLALEYVDGAEHKVRELGSML